MRHVSGVPNSHIKGLKQEQILELTSDNCLVLLGMY